MCRLVEVVNAHVLTCTYRLKIEHGGIKFGIDHDGPSCPPELFSFEVVVSILETEAEIEDPYALPCFRPLGAASHSGT